MGSLPDHTAGPVEGKVVGMALESEVSDHKAF